MLYLKSIVIDKFKSFKHAELLFSKGFTCIVGPNGSGKSAIFDALMFGLGDPSLKTLRVDRIEELISWNIKRKPDEPTVAHLKMEFDNDGETVKVVKAIRSDGKTSYRLNDKHITRRETIEFLARAGLHVDETTTIPQNQMAAIGVMNSKQRRELIDTAAGISDFEDKKLEALKELDKVDQKISESNIMLNERKGFLSGLEKEKEAAENWQRMTGRIRSLKYSVLVSKQDELSRLNDSMAKDIAIIDSKEKAAEHKLGEIKSSRDMFAEESKRFSSELNGINSTASEANAKLSSISNELAGLHVEIPGIQKDIEELKGAVSEYGTEVTSLKEKIKSNADAVALLGKKIESSEAKLGKLAVPEEGHDYEGELKALQSQVSEGQNQLIDAQSYLSKLQAELSSMKDKEFETGKQRNDAEAKLAELKKSREERSAELRETKSMLDSIAASVKSLDSRCSELGKKVYEIDGNRILLMEQKAMAKATDSGLVSKISGAFGEKDGFFGKASALCEYDQKDAPAVEAAAGGRFEYFVVRSIAVADKIIQYLKKNGLGRASFIPLEELDYREPQRDGRLVPVIEEVRFEPSFLKVFAYVFGDTYIIQELGDAKKHGIGKHRYVTVSGDLVEKAGIVSGGSAKRSKSLAAVERDMQRAEAERSEVVREREEKEAQLKEALKSKALLDMKANSITFEIGQIEKGIAALSAAIESSASQASAVKEQIARLNKEIEKGDAEKIEVAAIIEEKRKALDLIYGRLSGSAAEKANSKAYKELKEETDRLRHEVEAWKENRASLNTESQMLEKRAAELSEKISKGRKQVDILKVQLEDKELRRDVLLKSKSEAEREIGGKNEAAKKLIEGQNAASERINALSAEIGRLESEISGFGRQIGELRIRKSQAETRLNDILAELAAYSGGTEIVKGKLDEMEREIVILQGKVEGIGNINLKAPEVYEEMKKQMEEAQQKLETLEAEKDAVKRMMEEIDSKKLQIFMDTFNQVNKNFVKLYSYVSADQVSIALEDPSNPLDSGVVIKIGNGKSNIPVKSLSGGQQSILALALMLSIHICKKSSIYLFDEVDAALDAENAKKLSKLIKQISTDAQYIVVSHNNSLIVNADTAIGVTQDETKESKAIGIEIGSLIKNRQVNQ